MAARSREIAAEASKFRKKHSTRENEYTEYVQNLCMYSFSLFQQGSIGPYFVYIILPVQMILYTSFRIVESTRQCDNPITTSKHRLPDRSADISLWILCYSI